MAKINELVRSKSSMRAFSRSINEDCSDVSRWCNGKAKIKLRAVIEICRQYSDVTPHELNEIDFPKDLVFTFDKRRSKE